MHNKNDIDPTANRDSSPPPNHKSKFKPLKYIHITNLKSAIPSQYTLTKITCKEPEGAVLAWLQCKFFNTVINRFSSNWK